MLKARVATKQCEADQATHLLQRLHSEAAAWLDFVRAVDPGLASGDTFVLV